jgi:uncharacterized membrane protein
MKVLLPLALVALLSGECDTASDEAVADLSTLRRAEYLPARSITHTYCGPCHSKEGKDRDQECAYREFELDTYEQMKKQMVLMLNAITIHGTRADMPPATAKRQPSEAERQVLIDWLERDCPNTPDGR